MTQIIPLTTPYYKTHQKNKLIRKLQEDDPSLQLLDCLILIDEAEELKQAEGYKL